ncbi:NAD(P)H-quinone oxidoreductase subunit 2 [Caldalkalibacillus thermarum TA2.A1]|uniref:NADH-quinone oxidoreductase subunit N n=1 Tax=Caldalkalibacillus thermarum (strain TA2.A1) TaxID=986075 RepID=F5LA59_CALTT|nr:NADH-quinone oxidoreductase subunit NuoN [Caldalkalibacillus thermarum]EGL81779.1 NAD(P)H-quinone oxidoreductase subunit 2 [Caldalkalibacillus thermarum TA2.A1]QZT34154.1 NADH-quinone oxidoreductase subunit NuoN [Caldalkalibacillus thermarum TA2.A1]
MDLETLLSYPWRIMLPEFTILGVATLISLLDLFMKEKVERKVLAWIALGGIGLALVFLLFNTGQPVQEILYETYRLDGFANAFKFIFLIGAALIFLTSLDYVNKKDVPYEGEFYYLILTAVLGAMIVASSADMITLFVGLELLSISSYILVAVRKHHLAANESAMKYVISGGIATAVTLFGLSYIYGLTGTTNLFEIQERLAAAALGGYLPVIYFAFFVTFVGMAFKLSVVPFHMWAPDVYQGAPTPVTAFLSVVSKAAGFALVLRFFLVTMAGVIDVEQSRQAGVYIMALGNVELMIALVAAASMIIGNTMALRQTNVKRLFAYSSIAQAGYILVPFAVGAHLLYQTGPHLVIGPALFYLAAYLLMNLGAFAVIQLVIKDTGTEDIRGFAGLYKRAPFKAVAMTIFLASLAGIPFTAGFIGKYYILMGAVGAGLIWLAAVMLVTTVISYYYYFGVVSQMYMREPGEHAPLKTPAGIGAVLVVCIAGTILLGILPNLALDLLETHFNLVEIFWPARG